MKPNTNPHPTEPERISTDAWLVSELFDGPPGAYVPVRSLVLTGREPVIVDTGTSFNRRAWTEQVFSIVDPLDVRWVFLSHDDHDHLGNLVETMAHCPRATLVTNWFTVERLAGDLSLPMHRMRWLNDGESLDVGDRTIHAIRPPAFDSPTTRGLFDPRSGVYWASDAFASMVTVGATDAADVDHDLWEHSFLEMNRQISPWLAMSDEKKFAAQLARTTTMGATVVAGAHGAVLRDERLAEAYELMERLPQLPEVAFPGQDLLEAMRIQPAANAA